MKKFFVFGVLFAAMFLMMSCGGSDNEDGNNGDNGGEKIGNAGENIGNTGETGEMAKVDDNAGETGDNTGETGEAVKVDESGFATEPEAYLPASYADKILDAWYMLKDKNEDRIKIEAIFLFNDNSLVVTNSKVYSIEDGRAPENKISAEGTFTITSGDYINGTADVDAGGMQFEVIISGGVLSAMDDEFIKQDNADVPEPK